ncbi:Hypothetical protein CM240_0341 [Clostridium bornimense]|uniref:Uncharacterized protein n=1 Tax=Clostridium bornimense TaxID=1216932 RepID=W6RTB8_9CLOT|nr:hypothetical protein [Clostridium bornimense]CDM67508.1 Hypothetical protein CM240_0341 [Clostridium bornimense]
MDKTDERKEIGKAINDMGDRLHILKIYIAKMERMSSLYRDLITDLNNNKVQNFTDRMKKIKNVENEDNIEVVFSNLWVIVKDFEKDYRTLKNNEEKDKYK